VIPDLNHWNKPLTVEASPEEK